MIPISKPFLGTEEREAIIRVLEKGQLAQGEEVERFEQEWASYIGIKFAVATGSEGIAYLDYIEQELTLHNSHSMEVVKVEKAEPLKLELEHFLKCVGNDEKLMVDGDEGLKVLKIALGVNGSIL